MASSPAVPELREAFVFPASYAQRRLWFLHQFESASPVYNIPSPLRLGFALNVEALRKSLDELVRRHESLRTTFTAVDGEPMQVVAPSRQVTLDITDLRSMPAAQREAEAQRLASFDALRPFSLAEGPLLRVSLVTLAEADHVLLVTMHHIVSDGWSMGVFLRELGALYNAFSAGWPSPLPEPRLQYADYSHWQRELLRGDVYTRHLEYWRTQLAGAPPRLELPTDRVRPLMQAHRGAGHLVTLDADLHERLRALGQRVGATPFMVMLAAFDVLLYRATGQEDLVVGTPIANRGRPELEGLIGFFVNTLVLRTQLSGALGFQDVLARVREVTLGAYAHQDIPFEKLVEELQPERNLGSNPLFQVMFSFQSAERPQGSASPGGPEAPRVPTTTSKFDLTLSVAEAPRGGAFALFEYDTELFEPETVTRMGSHFLALLHAIVLAPAQPISRLPLLGDEERRRLLVEWNDTTVSREEPGFLHRVIVAQAARTPEAVALMAGLERVTYRELVSRANQLARFLGRHGVGPEVRVGVCMERSPELLVALLGILQAGGAYVPLDPEYPSERLAFMLEDSAPAVLITQASLASTLPGTRARVLRLDTEWAEVAREQDSDPALPVHPAQLAYVIYTSGSTGRPKGAMNSHAGIANRLAWMRQTYRLDGRDRMLHKTPTSFDVSITELFWPLMTGATVVIAKPGGHRDPGYLIDLMAAERVTAAHFVPSMLRVLLEHRGVERCEALRQVIISGEAVTPDLEARFHARFRAELHNLYGPTEAAVEVSAWTCPATGSGGRVPIGKPIHNTRLFILDATLEPVPVGLPGELFIGGIGVGRGYLGRPELTAERFIPDPFSTDPGQRLYRTGDRARFRADGNIDFLGRLDDQEKIRGFRIELGEVEAALRSHPCVRHAVVMAREVTPGDKRLVAYVVGGPREDLPGALRRHLSRTLPEHMVPTAFVALEALPLLPNGKLDRRALPLPGELDTATRTAYVAPRGAVEEKLAHMFAELLGRARVGVHDNFFELGGHSLLATRVVSRIHDAYGVEVPLRRLFETPTVEALAKVVAEQGATPVASAIPKLERDTELADVAHLSDAEVSAMLEELAARGELAK
ncbi:amino acid adenylation domain-containing protein [Myxococcus faecalis]|uniref:amino acid adenylation domain-containing protein n=1 Tax=Myxococcus faecalis TaxID=3115646 RepID=UPI003CF1F416